MSHLDAIAINGPMFGLSGPSLEARIDALLEQFELTAVRNKRLGQFSSGVSQKIGPAQALINDPKVLLLDEPCRSGSH